MFFQTVKISSALDNEGDEWAIATQRINQFGYIINECQNFVRILFFSDGEIISLPKECAELTNTLK